MKPLMKLSFGAAFVVVALVGALVTRPRPKHHPSAPTADSEEEVVHLPGVRVQPRRTPVDRSTPPQWAPPPEPDEHPDELTLPVRGQPAEPKQVAFGLKHHLDHEAPDPAWSTAMTGKLDNDIYGAKIEHTSSVHSRCGASLCEISLQYDADIDRNQTAMALGKLPSFEGGSFYQYDEQKHQMTVYVLKPGKTLVALATN